ncbi:uncharacterized protein N7506_011869 [Penicillium brevicompactum]|uniref:uncharacterized protein n=1 Tax=Penicillium brevicompactum TaxID=5074 RepID=UPI00254197B0|nr:uncharacterized protein N7506_011869 [Penicillium brevicompactum]KAJ5319165.1 hypothetical protein N7506_011869 [Penicillium brevicompactum]
MEIRRLPSGWMQLFVPTALLVTPETPYNVATSSDTIIQHWHFVLLPIAGVQTSCSTLQGFYDGRRIVYTKVVEGEKV